MVGLALTFVSNSWTKPLDANDTDVVWYKPIAVILKPATIEDLQNRLLQSRSPIQQYWPFDPRTQYEFRNGNPYQDKLREFYETFDLPEEVEGSLLSIARMGLVAIPKDEMGQGNMIV